jgi:hypothetical protein
MMLQDAPEYPQRRTLISCQHIGTYAFKGCGALDMVAFTTDAPHQQLPLGFNARSSGKGVLLLPKEGPVVGLQDCPILLPQVLPALQTAWAAVAKKAAPVEHARVLRKQVTSPSFDMFRLPPDMRHMQAGIGGAGLGGSSSSSFRRRSLSLVRSSLGSLHAVGNSAPLPSSLGGSGAMVQRQAYLYRGSLPAGSGALASLSNSKAADGLRSLAENLQQLLQVRGGSTGGSQRGSRASGSQQVTPDVTTHSAPLPSAAAAAAAGSGNSQRGNQQQQQQQGVELADQVLLQQLIVVGEPAVADAAATAAVAAAGPAAAVRVNGSDRGLSQSGGAPAVAKQQQQQQQQQPKLQQQLAVGGVSRGDAAAAHDVSEQ